jgi:hypothetical protein
MYRKHHSGQLSNEEFHVPFGGRLDPDNRWVLFSSLMPWEELEETHAPQFSPTTDAPAKSVRMAFGALFIKQRLGLSDEETVEQIRGSIHMQFFLGFARYSSKAPFDHSMMVHFRKAQPSRRVAILRGRTKQDQRVDRRTRKSIGNGSCVVTPG